MRNRHCLTGKVFLPPGWSPDQRTFYPQTCVSHYGARYEEIYSLIRNRRKREVTGKSSPRTTAQSCGRGENLQGLLNPFLPPCLGASQAPAPLLKLSTPPRHGTGALGTWPRSRACLRRASSTAPTPAKAHTDSAHAKKSSKDVRVLCKKADLLTIRNTRRTCCSSKLE